MEGSTGAAPPATIEAFRRRWPERVVGIAGQVWRHVDTDGAGPPIVMLPGAQGTQEMFWRQVTALAAEGRRCIAAASPADYDMGALATQLDAFLDAVGAGSPVDLLGSSYGGHLAQLYALRNPARVRRLVLANTFADASAFQAKAARKAAEFRALAPAQAQAELLGRVAQMPEATPEQAEFKAFLLDQVTHRQSAENLHARLYGVLAATPLPALPLPDAAVTLIDCADDKVILPEMKADLRARHPGARFVLLPHGGHYPGCLNAEAYTQALREALA